MTVATSAVYPQVVAAVFNRPWAVHPDTMAVIVEVVRGRIGGMKFDEAEIEARLAAVADNAGPREGSRQESSVQVIPVYGVISPRAGMMANSSGGTSVEGIRRQLRAALNDDSIDGIMLDIDSPGGSVEGIPELAAEIYEARGRGKPITAVANTMAASAAYWLGSQADAFYATPSASVGSIGVIAAHEDHSERFAKEGIKHTFVTSSQYKAEGNMAEPLGDEAKAAIQHDVDTYHAMFIDGIADGRGLDAETINSDFGQGRALVASDALEAGMVDGIMTFDDAAVATAVRAQELADAASPAVAGAYWGLVDGEQGWVTPSDFSGGFSTTTIDTNTSAPQFVVAPVSESFADRLDRVLGEAEAVATHAQERQAMRAEEGRVLSSNTRERLEQLRASLTELVSVPDAKAETTKAPAALDAYIKTLEGDIRNG